MVNTHTQILQHNHLPICITVHCNRLAFKNKYKTKQAINLKTHKMNMHLYWTTLPHFLSDKSWPTKRPKRSSTNPAVGRVLEIDSYHVYLIHSMCLCAYTTYTFIRCLNIDWFFFIRCTEFHYYWSQCFLCMTVNHS